MEFAATYYIGKSQFTPTRKRQHEAGWEPDYISATAFDEAFKQAKIVFLDKHLSTKKTIPTHILLIKKVGPTREFQTVEWGAVF